MREERFSAIAERATMGHMPTIEEWRGLSSDQRDTLCALYPSEEPLPVDLYERIEKICICCAHWRFDRSYTPGEDAEIYCSKKHWELDLYRDDEDSYATKLMTARTCADFTPSKVSIENLPEEE